MSNSVWPHKWQPTRLHRPWDSSGKNTGVGCHFLLQCMKVKSESEVAQSCPTVSDPINCSLPGSSVHGIFQARVLEWGAIAFSASMWHECNCAVVWAFFGFAFLWNWNENWPFPFLWPLLSFPSLLEVYMCAIWVFTALCIHDLKIVVFSMPYLCCRNESGMVISSSFWSLWMFWKMYWNLNLYCCYHTVK